MNDMIKQGVVKSHYHINTITNHMKNEKTDTISRYIPYIKIHKKSI